MSGIETLGGTHRGCKTPRDRTQHWCGIETASSGMSLSKTCVTCDSRVVPHRSTVQAHSCLTSEFGWDPVLSPWYDRMMGADVARRMGTCFAQGHAPWGLLAFWFEKRLLGRPEILLLDPVWGRRAGHWLKFSTSNYVASVYTSRAHILPPEQE